MATTTGLVITCAVHPKLPFKIQRYNGSKYIINGFPPLSKRTARIHRSPQEGYCKKYTCIGSNHLEFTSDDNCSEPFWSSMIKEFFCGLQSLLAFLAEQPGQLKYIEWPSFQSTLKTAMLTLILVVLLIVALSSVDAGLSFMLALLLRRTI